ncbi:MAG: hypothetical protein EGQ98_01165, partial [Clostridium sp.]|nr:hypothetical protein [Clostridium sp.]
EFSELKIPYNTVVVVDFADLECEASAKSVTVCAGVNSNQPQNFCNYYKQWLYECKEEEYTVHVWSLHTGRNFLI